jgi:hypothetical protein
MPWLWIVRVDWIIFYHLWISWRHFRFSFKIRKRVVCNAEYGSKAAALHGFLF